MFQSLAIVALRSEHHKQMATLYAAAWNAAYEAMVTTGLPVVTLYAAIVATMLSEGD